MLVLLVLLGACLPSKPQTPGALAHADDPTNSQQRS